ncbi:MAG: formylglycine-generating enzyme family protein [Planctomycetaceae bacterium]
MLDLLSVRVTRFCRSLAVCAMGVLLVLGVVGTSLSEELGVVRERPATGRFVEIEGGFMVPYWVTLPPSQVRFEMIPVPAGTFLLGSPADEGGRKSDEGPQIRVTVAPFWIAKTEVRWAEYQEFMKLYRIFRNFETAKIRKVDEDVKVDAITAPTELYEPRATFEYGDDPDLPAVSMTQYAAKQYSKWVSGITGQQYRLPSEAEWEYACRAGTNTAWSTGNDPATLREYARFQSEDRDHGPLKVGSLKPNAWGLYDMHGNIAEWVLDEYKQEGYVRLQGQQGITGMTAIAWPEVQWPRVVRGGSWETPAVDCRSAARLGSNDEEWQKSDPGYPRSPWWYTDAPSLGVGFRLMRSLEVLPRDQISKFWEIDSKAFQDDVDMLLKEGRGVQGLANPTLPQAIEEQRKNEK